MDPKGAYSNTKLQVKQLESLLRKLPDLSEPFQQRSQPRLPRTARQLESEQCAKLVVAYQGGATIYELTAEYKINRKTVSRILQDAGVTPRYRRLSAEQIQEAVSFYEVGWSLARIGEKFKVDPSTVHVRLRKLGVRIRDSHGR